MEDVAELIGRLEACGERGNYKLECEIAEVDGWQRMEIHDGITGHETWFTQGARRRASPPRYTTSIDDALRLLPPGWFWRVGYTTSFQAWAGVYKMHPDHTIEGKDEFNVGIPHHAPTKTNPATALTIACLKAHQHLRKDKVDG